MTQTRSACATEAGLLQADDMQVMLASVTRRRLAPGSVHRVVPPIDIVKHPGRISVRIEVPGVLPEDLQVTATPRVLTIEGCKRREGNAPPDHWLRMERTFGTFARSVALPPGALIDYAVAIVADGVLEVLMPVVERDGVLTGSTSMLSEVTS